MKDLFEVALLVIIVALGAALVTFCILSAALLAVNLFGI